jgi:hypothetical protein
MTTNGVGRHGTVWIILHIILLLIPTQRLMRIVETGFIKVHDEPTSKERKRKREREREREREKERNDYPTMHPCSSSAVSSY